MTRTVYLTATSADGFIADADNSLSWLFEVPTEENQAPHANEFGSFFRTIGAFVMGATTYEWVLDQEDMLEHPERWTEPYGDVPCWVLTHRELPPIPGVDLRFVEGDVAPIHAAMAKAADDKDIWIVGGGGLVAAFDDQGLLDEVRLSMQPVFLGSGAPLLSRRITSERMTLRSVEANGQSIEIVYDVTAPR
jgi:dihydrofolate reductase